MATSHACNFAVCAVNPRTHERQLVAHAFWGINYPTKQCTLTSTSGPARTSGSLGSALGPNASSQGAGGCAQCQGWISSTACHRRWRRRIWLIWRRSPPPSASVSALPRPASALARQGGRRQRTPLARSLPLQHADRWLKPPSCLSLYRHRPDCRVCSLPGSTRQPCILLPPPTHRAR